MSVVKSCAFPGAQGKRRETLSSIGHAPAGLSEYGFLPSDADGNLIGIHEDLEDEAQTVKVIQPEPAPKTGDESQLIAWGIVATLSLIAVVVISRKARKEEAIE